MAKNKMKTCKHCGAEIAKSAKECPSCGGKNKKPIFKRIWFWLLIVVLVIVAYAIGSPDETKPSTDNESIQEEQMTETEETTAKESETEESVAEEPAADVKTLKKELKKTYGLKGGSSVRNDVTDSWVIETIASAEAIDPTVWAYDYVQAYWNDSINVMWVVNFANNTTTSINTSDGSMLFVTQRDYVDKEEHDAKVLGGGTTLAEWVIYPDDGGKLVVERTDTEE